MIHVGKISRILSFKAKNVNILNIFRIKIFIKTIKIKKKSSNILYSFLNDIEKVFFIEIVTAFANC